MDTGVMFGGLQHGHVRPQGTYVNHGSLICDRIAEFPIESRMDTTYTTYYAMGRSLAKGYQYGMTESKVADEQSRSNQSSRRQEYVDQDI